MNSPSPGSDDPNLYWCFISYRHADNKIQDREWASWLHREIERYEVPAELVGTTNPRGDLIPERIYPVFRDEESLPADADLANTIVNALNRSRFLVVLCSPRARESVYVSQEIQHFKQLGHSDRIIAAILDGEPGDPARECFPDPLRHPLLESGELDTSKIAEPIAADFRLKDGSEGFTSAEGFRLARQGTLNKRQLRNQADDYDAQLQLMKLKIIAGILGVPLEQLRDRDKAYRLELARRRARNLRRWTGALAVLFVLACLAAAFGWWQQTLAAQARDDAEVARDEQKEDSARADFRLALEYYNDGDASGGDPVPEAAAFLARALHTDPSHPQAQRFAAQLLPRLLDRISSPAEPSAGTEPFPLEPKERDDSTVIQFEVGGAGVYCAVGPNQTVSISTREQGSQAFSPRREAPFPHELIEDGALSPGGVRLALTGISRDPVQSVQTWVYDVQTKELIGPPLPGKVEYFTSNGEFLVTSFSPANYAADSASSQYTVWESRTLRKYRGPLEARPASLQRILEIDLPIPVEGMGYGNDFLTVSASGDRAAAVVGAEALLINVPSRAVLRRIPLSGESSTVELSPDGNEVIEHPADPATPEEDFVREFKNEKGNRVLGLVEEEDSSLWKLGVQEAHGWNWHELHEGRYQIEEWSLDGLWGNEFEGYRIGQVVFGPETDRPRMGISIVERSGGEQFVEDYLINAQSGEALAFLGAAYMYRDSDFFNFFTRDLSQFLRIDQPTISFIDTQTSLKWLQDWTLSERGLTESFYESGDGSKLFFPSGGILHVREFARFQADLPADLPGILEQAAARKVDEGAVIRSLNRDSATLEQACQSIADRYPELKWAQTPGAQRTVTPYSTVTIREFVDQKLGESRLHSFLEAQRALPEDPLVWIALGLEEPHPARSRLLIELGLEACQGYPDRLLKAEALLQAYQASEYLPALAAEIATASLDPERTREIREAFPVQPAERPTLVMQKFFGEALGPHEVSVRLTIQGSEVQGEFEHSFRGVNHDQGPIPFQGTTDRAYVRVRFQRPPQNYLGSRPDPHGYYTWKISFQPGRDTLDLGKEETAPGASINRNLLSWELTEGGPGVDLGDFDSLDSTPEPAPAPALEALPGERYAIVRERLLTRDEIAEWSEARLRYAINETYARYGYDFSSTAKALPIHQHFLQFDWYRPRTGVPMSQISEEMTEIEKANIVTLAEARRARNR